MKTSALLIQYPADQHEWLELLGSAPSEKTLSHVGITPRLWRSIASGRSPSIPAACLRLARYSRHLQLAELLGRQWEGFEIRGDALLFPGLRSPLSCGDLRGLWLSMQENASLRSRVQYLTRRLDDAESRADAHEKAAYYWRRQVALESRAGLMLAGLMA